MQHDMVLIFMKAELLYREKGMTIAITEEKTKIKWSIMDDVNCFIDSQKKRKWKSIKINTKINLPTCETPKRQNSRLKYNCTVLRSFFHLRTQWIPLSMVKTH